MPERMHCTRYGNAQREKVTVCRDFLFLGFRTTGSLTVSKSANEFHYILHVIVIACIFAIRSQFNSSYSFRSHTDLRLHTHTVTRSENTKLPVHVLFVDVGPVNNLMCDGFICLLVCATDANRLVPGHLSAKTPATQQQLRSISKMSI